MSEYSLEELVAKFRNEFPALSSPLVYLDSAATSLRPKALIDATSRFYSQAGNVYRSQYKEALTLTELYESTRQLVANLINSPTAEQIIWTKGATESANLIAHSFLSHILQPGDELIVSQTEHHANLIPWIMLAKSHGAKIVPLPLNADNAPDINSLKKIISNKTKLLAITQMSNVTGATTDLKPMISLAHQNGCVVVVDGAQGIVHHPVDVKTLEVDFYYFSAHKLYGPTGVGVLYASENVLEQMQPWQGGGKMLSHAKMDDFIAEDPPFCFEPGTPNLAGIIGFNATLNWLTQWPLQQLENYAVSLASLAHEKLSQLKIYKRISVAESTILTFTLEGIHANDLAILLAEQNIAVRSGLHCAHPLNKTLGLNGSTRASFAPFNTLSDVELFVEAINKAVDILLSD